MSTTPSDSSDSSSPRRRAKAKKSTPEIRIKVSWCKGCGLCVDYCNQDVLVMDGVIPKVIEAEKCTWCLQCEAICPDFAIEVREAGAGKADDAQEGREKTEPAAAGPATGSGIPDEGLG